MEEPARRGEPANGDHHPHKGGGPTKARGTQREWERGGAQTGGGRAGQRPDSLPNTRAAGPTKDRPEDRRRAYKA